MNAKSFANINLDQLLQWAPKVISTALVVAIAYALTNIVWQLMGSTDQENTVGEPIMQPSSKRSSQAMAFANAIAQQHLFGEADAAGGTGVIDVKETTLNLKLIGILAIGDKDGLALIASGGQKEKVFRVGATVPGNATLKSVHADRVILESSRGLEMLKLRKEQNLIEFTSSGSEIVEDEEIDQEKAAKNATRSLQRYRRDIMRNPATISQIASVQKEMDEEGNLIGYKVKPKNKNDALFKTLGLADGDVITAVNGIEMTNPANGLRALTGLRRAKEISVDLMRDGEPMNIRKSFQ